MSNDREARDLRPYMLNAPTFDFPPAAATPPAPATANTPRPSVRGTVRTVDLMRGPHSTQPQRGGLSASAEADLRALRLQRRRNREHQRRIGANGGVTAAWNAVGRGRRAATLDGGLAEDDPEMLSPLFQPPNVNPPSNRRQRRWGDNWDPAPNLRNSGMPDRCHSPVVLTGQIPIQSLWTGIG
jgi:hypothetical protein